MNRSRPLQNKPCKHQRSGATVVEFALIAVPLFLIIFASFEFSYALLANQSLNEAARSGCRVAILRGTTTSDVEAEVKRILAPTRISNYSLEVLPVNRASMARWAPVTVTITVTLDNMSWLFLVDKTYTASCTLPKECSPGG